MFTYTFKKNNRAGFAGENAPRCFLPSSVPCRKDPNQSKKLIEYEDEADLYQMLVDFLNTIYFKYVIYVNDWVVKFKSNSIIGIEIEYMYTRNSGI